MARGLPQVKQTKKQKKFDFIPFSSGVLKPKEFIRMYEKFFPANDANMFAENVFRNFDADKNGSIDFTEFMIAIDVTSSGSPREKLMWAFRLEIDTNTGVPRSFRSL